MQIVFDPFVCFVCFLITAVFSYPIYRLLLLTKAKQTIDPHAPETHQVKQGTPTMGGLIVLVSVLALLVIMNTSLVKPFDQLSSKVSLLGYVGMFVAFAAIGFIDDFVVPKLFKKRGLGWIPKIIMQFGAAFIGAYPFMSDGLLWVGGAIFCILMFSNAYNFADGLDGLAGSIWLGLAAGLLIVAGPNATNGLYVVQAITAGVLVFLFYNAPPAKMFMGDVGSLPIGAVYGLVFTEALFQPSKEVSASLFGSSVLVPLLVLSFVLFAELFPVPMQVAYYKLTKKRLFPFTPIHHAFEKKGWPETRVVWMFALVQAVLSMVAVMLVRG